MGRVVGLAGTANEHVADGEFAGHFLEEVVELVAGADAVEVWLVALLSLGQVEAVVIGVVEEVAFDAPGLVVHLAELSAGIDVGLQAAEVEGFAGVGFHGVGGGDEPGVTFAVKHLFAIGGDDKAADAGEDFGGLALIESEAPDGTDRWPVSLGGIGDGSAFRDVEHALLACLEVDVIARRNGQSEDALVDAVEVDFDGGRLLLVLLAGVFVLCGGFVFLAAVFIFGGLIVCFLCVVGGLGFVLCLFVIALGRQGRGEIFSEHDDINAAGNGAIEAGEIEAGDGGADVSAGGEVEVLAVAVEGDAANVAHAIGYLRGLLCIEGVEIDGVQEVMQGFEVADPLAVGGPGGTAGKLKAFVILGVDFDGVRVVDVEIPEVEFLVGVKDTFRVRGPVGRVEVGGRGAEVDHLRRSDAVLIADEELVLAGGIAEVGDGFSIRRPGRVALGGV